MRPHYSRAVESRSKMQQVYQGYHYYFKGPHYSTAGYLTTWKTCETLINVCGSRRTNALPSASSPLLYDARLLAVFGKDEDEAGQIFISKLCCLTL